MLNSVKKKSRSYVQLHNERKSSLSDMWQNFQNCLTDLGYVYAGEGRQLMIFFSS